MKKIAIVALAAAATFITSCDIERLPYERLLRKTEKGIRTLALLW